MTTITVWLLISVGGYGGFEGRSAVTLGQFPSAEECARVMKLFAELPQKPPMRCIQATVAK